ncbi:MAG: hypothetical protein KGJ72_13735, partial [Gammaproteobacteria bacterium]|nr:hypothetical protein [Gammaproteobacteria bacterium]
MTATDRRSQAPRAVGLSVLLAGAALGAALLARGQPAQAQGIAAAAQVPFPPGRAAMGGVPEVPHSAYSQLRWRLVGPFRGGWATMAAGVPASPDTFYFA